LLGHVVIAKVGGFIEATGEQIKPASGKRLTSCSGTLRLLEATARGRRSRR